MKLKLDKKHENRIEFIAEGVSTSFANLIRRYAMSAVPVVAVDKVTFYDNTSAFWDEYIAHRIGLMPVTTPEKTSGGVEVTFSLDAEGPGVVYATDMKSTDGEIVMAKKIPLVTLGQNQHLRFEARAVLSTARKHAKFQAGLVSYGVEDKSLRIFAESFYQMPPADVISRACDVLMQDVERVEAALGTPKPAKKAKAAAKKKVSKKKAKK